MTKKNQVVQVGKRKVELSNLDKVLFPEDGIVKAEVVEFYLSIAPTILSHIKGRPLTLIRYPDGIHGESFYQKNRPEWSPEWIEFVTLGTEKKDYILATEPASLVWLANLASLELHQMHCRKPNFEFPDYMVFDLDPPEGYTFTDVIAIALNLKEHIESFGYSTFVKTTGGKGLHVVVPLEPLLDFNTVFDTAQLIAKPFVEKYSKETTLHIKKEARKGRVLIDIYRNRNGQSIVSPYSLRGRIGAPVSMPLLWEDLKKVKSPLEFSISTVPKLLSKNGDAWEGIDAYATSLHTHRSKATKVKELPKSRHHKSPEQLKSYGSKRDFKKTPEPAGEVLVGKGNGFVVHRHHASHIHYDLRLEKDGVLRSWAVPRGLPPRPGIKRLAVQTEDHPMQYLTFEGTIPKGQYGGGDMWVFMQGRYEITKEKKDGSFYFRLISKVHTGEYRMYQIKPKEWLLERVDETPVALSDTVEFMLSETEKKIPTGDDYVFEVKWDGIRAMITLDEGEIRIKSRNHNNITAQFPELITPPAFRAVSGVFDAEIVSLNAQGKPEFKKVINRLMASGKTNIEKAAKTNPVYCYIFDCLYLDGRSVMNDSYARRRTWIEDIVKTDSRYRVSQIEKDGKALFEAAKEHALEGIMAKRLDGKYLPGKRSENWIKIKVRDAVDCVIIGFTEGKGNRELTFGSLHVAELKDGEMQYRGRVGTGFDDKLMKEIAQSLKKLKVVKKPFAEKVMDEKITTWVEPTLFAEVSYSMITKDKMFREPVFVRLRPDLGQ
jgi:DNA ligase D-like protein (predicted ligase)/DNA ligase D-like protein (predicted polymerase)/DNA ligase D-like protein (predicted 3'-phosphoesterase)